MIFKKIYMYYILKKLSKKYICDDFVDGLEFNLYWERKDVNPYWDYKKASDLLYEVKTYLKNNKVDAYLLDEDELSFIIIRYRG